jgi:hypothetical protein
MKVGLFLCFFEHFPASRKQPLNAPSVPQSWRASLDQSALEEAPWLEPGESCIAGASGVYRMAVFCTLTANTSG